MLCSRNVLISILQIISAIATLFAFFAFIPWLLAEPIENLATYDNAPKPPPNAECFSVGKGGSFSFFTDSPSSNKPKAAAVVIFLLLNWAFLIISAMYFTRKRNNDLNVSSDPKKNETV